MGCCVHNLHGNIKIEEVEKYMSVYVEEKYTKYAINRRISVVKDLDTTNAQILRNEYDNDGLR